MPRLVAYLLTLSAGCGWFGAGPGPDVERRCETRKSDGCFTPIPGGTYTLGAQSADPSAPHHDPDATAAEGPVREVTIAPFWIQLDEARFSDWRNCKQAGACPDVDGPAPGVGNTSGAVSAITWNEADALCRFMGGRLPTGEEWEVAARGHEDRRYPWGNDPPCGLGVATDRFNEMPSEAWNQVEGCQTADPALTPRGRSPFAIVDMAWGHWEWTADGDPEHRVQRGGSWAAEDPVDHRVTSRMVMPGGTRLFDVGVRCAF